ncbi:MAG TPA: hypothetical protein VN613_01075, partial [Gemmatimonadaceae bacterium]|nr:hypothetical protein [Gemmatimonadaceae bacterium]
IIWAELNAECDALRELLPTAVEIRGNDDALVKESRLTAFSAGEIRTLITKPAIAGFGLNWQHCHKQAFVGVSDSFEKTYQAIRRSWRFGQTHTVDVHFFASELEGAVVENYQRKQRDAVAMSEQLSAETRDAVRAEVRGLVRETNAYVAREIQVPAWLASKEGDIEP